MLFSGWQAAVLGSPSLIMTNELVQEVKVILILLLLFVFPPPHTGLISSFTPKDC